MNHRDSDELLWELSALEDSDLEENGTLADLSREVLEAWRAGRLGDAEAARVESALAHHQATRERLYQMASVELPSPPAALRGRVLASVAAARRSAATPATPKTLVTPTSFRRPFVRNWMAQAAALAAVCLLALGWYLHTAGGGGAIPADIPAEMEFHVGIEMLAEVRSTPAEGLGAAYAETKIRIVVEPVEEARAGLDFGLYRERGGVWERLPTGGGIRLKVDRGTALFEAPAQQFVGAEPGSRDLLVAVANTGRLPETFEPVDGKEAAGVLAAKVGGKVYRHTIVILPSLDFTEEEN